MAIVSQDMRRSWGTGLVCAERVMGITCWLASSSPSKARRPRYFPRAAGCPKKGTPRWRTRCAGSGPRSCRPAPAGQGPAHWRLRSALARAYGTSKSTQFQLVRRSVCLATLPTIRTGNMSQREHIVTGKHLPQWSNPISHAVVVNGMCFVSGQLSVGLDGQYVEGSFREEAGRAFDNLFAVLAEAGFSKHELAFVDVAVLDMSQMHAVNELYEQHFAAGKRPARTVAQVAALPFGGKVKLMGTAVHDVG